MMFFACGQFEIIFLLRNFRMESTGKPEQVHISEQTCSFLGDNYLLDEGEDVEGWNCNFPVPFKFEFCSFV